MDSNSWGKKEIRLYKEIMKRLGVDLTSNRKRKKQNKISQH